ncbi:DUF2326 domain-containing protein [Candidatus Pacearchaeota archaeon]|nr:DUF2326 domain-containing protein [Candidatus Pacearchaeota archaeon]
MIFLKEISSEPSDLFDTVKFKKGINVIYGKQIGNQKPSLNSIGKSTLISLIDFCLLSEFNKKHKLYKAKSFLDNYKIVLKIDISGKELMIKRSSKNDKKIFLTEGGEKEMEINIEDAKKVLYKKMFFSKEYCGVSEGKWFRSIIPLLIRNEKKGFLDTIEYISEVRRHVSTRYHLMLMNIDNTFSDTNLEYIKELKMKEEDLGGIKRIIENQYGDIESINNQADKLKKEIEVAEESKKEFQLNSTYEQEQEKANELTKQIKKIILENNHLRDLLDGYKESYKLEIDIDTKKISSIYKEIDESLSLELKKTLDEAVEFKNKLIDSRKNFIKNKVKEIERDLIKNSLKIKSFDLERANIFNFLENKKAIGDLNELFNLISDKKQVYDDLKSKISLIEDLNKSYLNKKTQYSKLQEEINEFIKAIKTNISSLREIYTEIYDSLYHSENKEGFFDIVFDKNKKSKIYIVASSQDADGFGKGRGCILVYDLMLLFNIVKNKINNPHFWIHDGVFNGVYKNQFVSAMNLLNKKAAELEFQYIITLNEDEEIIADKKFGKLEFDIKDNVIAEYTNETKGKIFKREF